MKTSPSENYGIFDSLSTETITISAYKYNPNTYQNDRLVTWNEKLGKIFFRPLEVSGERIKIYNNIDNAVIIHTEKEPELIVDDSNWIRTISQGGTKYFKFEIRESEFSDTSAKILSGIPSGYNLGQILIQIKQPYKQKENIYSLGLSSTNFEDREFLIKKFRLDSENEGIFKKFEVGN
ncbi:MAG: hypothetical protein D6834_03605, partial [Aquificota bacterium]